MNPTITTLEELNAMQRWAWTQVRIAVRKGILIKPETCPHCGRKARLRAHHEDYSKPLDVDWRCTSCHHKRHADEVAKAAQRLGIAWPRTKAVQR